MKNNNPNIQLPFSDLTTPQDVTDLDFAAKLLQIKHSTELGELLREKLGDRVFSIDKFWRPVGDLRSNAGPIEASPDEINPLVERIVNGIEAVTELGVAAKQKQQPHWQTPNSPSKAIESLFNIPEGAAEKLDQETARTKFGDLVQLILRGRKDMPTIVIRDKGIGIHPSDFAKTIVSLGQSSKGQKEYLIGMYGQGGSSAFEKSEYSIIFSRKHPSLLSSDEPDLAGWTIVRKRLSVRTHIYEYLINPETRQVFTVAGTACEKIKFTNGTYVCHVSYKNLGQFATQKITNYAWYTLNFRLFNPLIPWTLIDERDGATDRRTMRGVPYRINQLPKSTASVLLPQQRKGENTSVRHHIRYVYQDPSYGSILVEWWVLQSEDTTDGRREHSAKVDPYRDPSKRYAQRRVAITRGGQVHSALTPNVFSREGLRFIANSIIVNVNTDQLSYESGASFFASNRADLKRESEEIVEKAIGAAIFQYRSELIEIQREREREIIRGRGAKDEDVLKTKLDPMIKAFLNSVLAGTGDATRRRRGDTPKFRGRAIPTTLEFARSAPLEITPGIPTHLELITDASDSVMRSRKTSLRFLQSISPEIAQVSVAGGSTGRWRLRILPYTEVSAGTKCNLSAVLEQASWRLETRKSCQLVVVALPPEYLGNNPPTYMRFRTRANNEVHIQQGGGRVTIDTDCDDDLFDYARPHISLPDNTRLVGYGHPSRGQIRLTVQTEDDIELGQVGKITASLEFSNGSSLVSEANLVIVEKRKIESSNSQYAPNYSIHYVREVTTDEDERKWDDMTEILSIDSPWGSEDVGGIFVAHDEGSPKLHIYINVDNKELLGVETRMARTNTEKTIESFRQNHRALITYHLYLLGISDESGNLITDPEKIGTGQQMDYDHYRNEMIRLNRTALYATKEYLDTIKEIEGIG
jgi:hypothetical protein